MIETPAGYEARRAGPCLLLARPEALAGLLAAGLEDPAGWPEAGVPEAGRGAILRRELPGVGPVVLKRMRRGGLTAALWRGRFPGWGRLIRNLTVADEAARRGVPTARPIALWLRAGPPGLYRGWLAVQEIPGAADLLTVLRRGASPLGAGPRAAIAAVRRLHDAGVEHPDLNLGNLLVREDRDGARGFVIDLDRAVLHPEPLSTALRRVALLRLERSYLKCFGASAPSEWRHGYVADDAALASLTRTRGALARLGLGLHRLSWSLRGGRADARSPVAPPSRRDPRSPDDGHGA